MGLGSSKRPPDKYRFEIDEKAQPFVVPLPTRRSYSGPQDLEHNTMQRAGQKRGLQGGGPSGRSKFKRSATVPAQLGKRSDSTPSLKSKATKLNPKGGGKGGGSGGGKGGGAKAGKFDWIGKGLEDLDARRLSLNQLEVEDPPIGRGGCGHVRLVRAKSSGKYYALKCVEKRSVVKHNDIRHLKSEKEVLNCVVGMPFFVQLYGTFQDPYYCYFLMEYAVGGELFTQLYIQRRFQEDRARFYACEVLSALESLHSQRIMFRDLKPENLLLDENGHVKVTDFGFAKELEPNDKCYSRIGTPHYLSPEILDKNSKEGYCISADWWAFACFVYEILAGKSAWGTAKSNKHEVLIRIMKGRFSIPSHFSPAAKSLCKSMMTHKFGKRLIDVAEIKRHAFFAEVDWKAIREQRVKVPHRPKVHFPGDRGNFDSFPVTHASEKEKISKLDEAMFDSF